MIIDDRLTQKLIDEVQPIWEKNLTADKELANIELAQALLKVFTEEKLELKK